MLKDLSAGIDVWCVRAQIHNVGVEVEAMEKKIRESPLSDLYASLNAAINSNVVGSDSGELTLREALFQADAAIAVEAVKGNVDIIGSTDSDFHMLAGDAAVTISEIKFLAGTKKREASFSCVKMRFGRFTLLSIPTVSCKKGDSPVLDGQPLAVRALIGVAIGCDANPGGIQDIGPSSVRDSIIDIEAKILDMYSALLGWMVEKSKEHSAKELEVLAQTIIYEPGNCTDEEEDAP